MKKISTLLLVLIFSVFTSFAKERLISINWGVSTGAIFYDPNENNAANQFFNTESQANKFLIGSFLSLNLNLVNEASFFIGADLMTDFQWEGNYYNNKLSFDIPFGIKIYPNLGGINFGIAYVTGFRNSFLLIPEIGTTTIDSPWGNGFKISFEYNFAHVSDFNFLPIIGCYWKLMPRGQNTWDNHVSAYLAFNF